MQKNAQVYCLVLEYLVDKIIFIQGAKVKIVIIFLLAITCLFSSTKNKNSLENMAKSGNATAAFELAQFYENTNDLDNAVFWYKESAKLFLTQNQININILEQTNNLNENNEEALISGITLAPLKDAATQMQKTEKIFNEYLDTYKYDETKNTVIQSLSATFGLLPYHSNYLLPATYDFRSHKDGRKHMETLFQISFKKDIFNDIFGFDENIGLAYTQRSWWQITETSAPFRETNYLPEVYVMVPYKSKDSVLKGFQFGFLHESNGQGDDDGLSRSWNRLYLEGYFQYSGIFFIPRVWYKIDDSGHDGEHDLEDYIGYADLKIIAPYKEHMFKMMLRNNFDFSDNRGAVQLEWTFPLWKTGLFGYLQYFYGYGESLIDYDTKTNRIGLGIAVSR